MKIEKIKFERTGGFAGIRLAAEIVVDKLPADQRNKLFELIDEIDLDDVLETLVRKAPLPDEFTYNIIVTTKHIDHTIFIGDSSMPEDMRPLVEMLEGIAKKQMRKRD